LIPENFYRQIISVLPVVCVDIIIRSETGKFLLARRKNQPLKEQWWVIGGRILAEESAYKACVRKVFEETGLEIHALQFIGFYEDVFDKNSFDEASSYHTISLVFETKVSSEQLILLDKQHSEWNWFDGLPDRFTISTQNLLSSQLDAK
jgi:colanic acid biosynthesis protein WcaH